MLPMKVFTALFYVHTIGKHDEQNSLNLGLVRLHMKHEVSTKQMLHISLKRRMTLTGIQVTFYLLFLEVYVQNV